MTVSTFRRDRFQVLDRFGIRDSLGILYGLVTAHLGFAFNADEYKVMGLAPYGDPARFRAFFDGVVTLRDDGRYAIRLDRLAADRAPFHRDLLRALDDQVIARPDSSEALPPLHCDFAAAAQ